MRRLTIWVLLAVTVAYPCEYRAAPIGYAYSCQDSDPGYCPSCTVHPSFDTHSDEYHNPYMGFSVQMPVGVVGFSTHMLDSNRAWLDYHGVAIDPVNPTGTPIDPGGNDKSYIYVDAQCNVVPTIDEFLEGDMPGIKNLRKRHFRFKTLAGRKITYERDAESGNKRKLYYIDYWFRQPNGEYSIYYDVGLRTTLERLEQDKELLDRLLAGFTMQKPIGTCD
jgi:hypothetical protein